MEDIKAVFGIIGLALLGLLVLMVIKNMLWGMKRGGKRTIIRIVAMIVTSLVLLVLTPLVSKLMWNLFLENLLKGIDGLGETIVSMENSLTGTPAAGLANFPLVIVNIIVFIVLQITLFKWLSYTLFRIIAGVAVPKLDKETGEKISHSKLFGMLMGIVQGFVAFFFFMLPFNALIYSVNMIERHELKLSPNLDLYSGSALLSVGEEGKGDYFNLHSIFHDIDEGLNAYGYSTITRITGIQWASGFTSTPLYKIPETNVNVRADFVTLMQLTRDVEQIADLFESGRDITSAEFTAMDEIVDRAFDITLLQMACDAGLGTVLDDFGLLDTMLEELDTDDKISFKEGLDDYASVDSLKGDFKQTIRVLRCLFNTKVTTAQDKTMIEIIGEFLEALGLGEDAGDTDTSTASANMKLALDFIPSGETKTLSDLIFVDGFGEIGLFKDFLFGNDLHAVFISGMMDISVDEARIDNFQAVMASISDILYDLTDVADNFSELINTISEQDFSSLAELLTDQSLTTSLSNILGTLTNPKKACEFDDTLSHNTDTCACDDVWGIANIVRGMFSKAFENMRGNNPPAEDELSVEAISYELLDAFVTELESSRAISWKGTLELFGEFISLFELDFDSGLDGVDQIIEILDGVECDDVNTVGHDTDSCTICKKGLLEKMSANLIFKPVADKFDSIISGYIKDVYEETLADLGLTIDFGDLSGTEIMKLTLKIQENLSEVGEKIENGEINFDSAEGVDTLLSTAGAVLDELASKGVQMTNPEWTNPETGEIIDADGQAGLIQKEIDKIAATDPDRAEQMQSWLWVLGLPSTYTPGAGK